MGYQNSDIAAAAEQLLEQAKTGGKQVLNSPLLKSLYAQIPALEPQQRASFGQELNALKNELTNIIDSNLAGAEVKQPIDITAPFDVNSAKPKLLPMTSGSRHPLTTEIDLLADIAYRMGFNIEQSRELDDDYHMFESLNFPEGHPARDDYDTFMTDEGLVAPAHTSTMQNRVLKKYAANLAKGQPIAVIVPDRVFRNEDLDVTHEHTFYQYEGVYVDKGVNVGHLIATLRAFLSEYFGQELKAKLQPFYFPFTEPSFEFAIERPKHLRRNDTEAEQWLELLGCGMIHPNVLKMADIDPEIYSGFAWGGGVERLVLMKYGIEDIRYFESAKLEFLRQFK